MPNYYNTDTKQILKIEIDDFPSNPRDDSNLSVLSLYHKNFDLPDEGETKLDMDIFDNCSSWNEVFETHIKNDNVLCAMPVYMMDHSSLSFSIKPFGGDYGRWDSGQVGWIYTTKENLASEFDGLNLTDIEIKDKVLDIFKCELERFQQYVSGECYEYFLYKNFEDFINKETDDCCSGYDCIEDILKELDFTNFKKID